jgi:hypothetical protein
MWAASLLRMLSRYPATVITMGSPNGAIASTLMYSPGMQPISMSFTFAALLSNCCMNPEWPTASSESFFNAMIRELEQVIEVWQYAGRQI